MDIPWDPERIAAGRANFMRLANEAGLEVGERTRWYDSTLAHEAAEWAHEQGPPEREEEFRRAIFRAYFVDNQNIADPEVLVSLAQAVQPSYAPEDLADLRAALAEHRYLNAVQQQYREAREVGVTGVPTYVAGGYALVGAHPYEHFHQLMAAVGQSPQAQSDGQRGAEG